MFVSINSKKKRKSEASEKKSSNIASFLSKASTSKSPNLSRKDDGFLTYEELVYWQQNFKLPNCEAGTTPLNPNRRRSSKSLPDPPVKELSLNEWMAWQNVPSQVHKIAHSRRTEHLIEILEFIELHGERDSGDDAYDVEMMTFLNEEDLVRPEDDAMILGDADDNGGNNDNTEKNKKKKKSISKENESDRNKNNNLKQSKITRKAKKSKSTSPQQKTKWREYLKGFENDDNDFDTGAMESKNTEEKQDNELESLTDQIPNESLENQEAAKGTEDILPENQDTEMEEEDEDDAFHVSSQTFSQLLPSLTPQKVNVLRTRITDDTDINAQSIPLPPSLDSLDEISPFTGDKSSTSCDKETARKSCREKIFSCRRNINPFDETEVVMGPENDEKLPGDKTKNLTSRRAGKSIIEEPPVLDLDFDFENEINEKSKIKKNPSKHLTKNISTLSPMKKLIEDPPEIGFDFGFENEFGKFASEEENLMLEDEESSKSNQDLSVRSQSRNARFFPEKIDPLVSGESEDDFQEKARHQSSQPSDNCGFGAGVVCKNKASEVPDDDIEIEFGDDSLADGLLADLDEEEFGRNGIKNHPKSGNNQGISNDTIRKSKDESVNMNARKNLHIDTQDDETKIHGENLISRIDTAPKKSKLKLSSKEKSLCDNSLSKSILKLGAFERNAENSTKKPFNFDTDSEEVFDQSTHREDAKKFEIKSIAHQKLGKIDGNLGENAKIKEDFNFKKPDAIPGSRGNNFNRSTVVSPKSCKNPNHENSETMNPVFTSSPLRKSLKLNSKSNVIKKQDNSNRELSSCREFEEEKNSKLYKMQNNQTQSYSPFKDLRTSPCPTDKYSDVRHSAAQVKKDDAHKSDSDDSPILRKPLREGLANRGLEENVNNINSAKCNREDLGIILNSDDSPVVRKKSKSRTLQNIAAISPLQGSQSSLRELDVHDGESPVVRRRSKAKIRDGNVFAIAESDEEFEDDVQETDLRHVKDDGCNLAKAKGTSENRVSWNNEKMKGIRNRKFVGTPDSEEEFLQENRKGTLLTARAQSKPFHGFVSPPF